MERQFVARGLKYHVFPVSTEMPKDIDLYNDTYRFWHNEWLQTFGELKGSKTLYSDDFHRTGEKTILTFKNEIIAYFGLSWFNLDIMSHAGHSYFKSYPKEMLAFFKEQNIRIVMSMGWLSVAKEWRRSNIGSLVTDTIVLLGYRRFVHSPADTLIAFTRNDRSINELVYRNGSRCFKSGLQEHNVEVDAIYTLKPEVQDSKDKLIRETVNRLWNERIVHGVETPVAAEEKKKAA